MNHMAHRPRARSHLVGKWQEPSLDRRFQTPAEGLSKDNSLTPAVLSFLQFLELLLHFYSEFIELEVHICVKFSFVLAGWALVCR